VRAAIGGNTGSEALRRRFRPCATRIYGLRPNAAAGSGGTVFDNVVQPGKTRCVLFRIGSRGGGMVQEKSKVGTRLSVSLPRRAFYVPAGRGASWG
jgi:hypothetical protein